MKLKKRFYSQKKNNSVINTNLYTSIGIKKQFTTQK